MKVKTNLGAIITAVDPQKPTTPQVETIESWRGAAGSTFIWTADRSGGLFGYNYLSHNNSQLPLLKDALIHHFRLSRGKETIGFAAPTIAIGSDFTKLFALIDQHRLLLSWAAFMKPWPEDEVPRLFVMTAPILPHLIMDVPANITMVGQDWLGWLNNWFSKKMQKHMYIGASSLGIISAPNERVPEPIGEPVQPKKKKKKK